MASAFGHAFGAAALGTVFRSPGDRLKFFSLGMVASILPDADVITFAMGIPYNSLWGHRGISHSAPTALLIGLVFTLFFYPGRSAGEKIRLTAYFFLCALSHALLDMLTNGGLGVALFAPFENNRHFFDYRPIQVSPIGIGNFFSQRGLEVILSELIWIGVPGLIVMTAGLAIRFFKR